MMRGEGIAGIAFRIKDPFTFYTFEISRKHQFKRIRRVVNGQSKIICEKKDGGYRMHHWYRVKK